MTVLAERLDEALAKLETHNDALLELKGAVETLADKLAKPFAQLDGRMDGVVGRMDGVVGRMDGLEDKLAHIHKRLDELGVHLDKQDDRPESLPTGEVDVEGLLREPWKKNMFTPENRPDKNEFYFPDVKQMAALTGSQPVWIEQTMGTSLEQASNLITDDP